MSALETSLLEQLRPFSSSTKRYVVAYSGGCDSHVLLHALVQIKDQFPSQNIRAIHVDHGLQTHSPDWAEHCRQVCVALNVPIDVLQLNLSIPKGESTEAYARQQRYAAIQTKLTADDILLLAQHQDDQAETLLLQMLRGSGVKGLASMPFSKQVDGVHYLRPLLNLTRNDIQQYAIDNQLNWIDDPSNEDTRFDRNFLRHEIIPKLKSRWPSLSDTFNRVASHQAEANALLTEVAAQDLKSFELDKTNTLPIESLVSLSPARQRNVLRYWIEQCGSPVPDSVQLQRILDEVVAAADDAEPLVSWSGVNMRRYRAVLHLDRASSHPPSNWQMNWDWQSPLNLPLGQQLRIRQLAGQGLALPSQDTALTVRFRRGGEKCQLPGRKHRHELKKLMQDWGIPPWQRGNIPLIYVGDELAQVVGYSVCEPYIARADQTGLDIYLND